MSYINFMNAFVVCGPPINLVFYHVPKAGGTSLTQFLLEHGGGICNAYWGIMKDDVTIRLDTMRALNMSLDFSGHENLTKKNLKAIEHLQELIYNDEKRLDEMHGFDIGQRYDSAHISVNEINGMSRRTLGGTLGEHESNQKRLDIAAIDKSTSFSIVRNPYLRVVSAFHQRFTTTTAEFYNRQWLCKTECPFQFPLETKSLTFVRFMRLLREGIKNNHIEWSRDFTFTHFRPATFYTHQQRLPCMHSTFNTLQSTALRNGTSGQQAVDLIFKQASLHDLQQWLFSLLNAPVQPVESVNPLGSSTALPHLNSGDSVHNNTSLCMGLHGCEQRELSNLLEETSHTMETIGIVNELYKDDFDLLYYNMLSIGSQQ